MRARLGPIGTFASVAVGAAVGTAGFFLVGVLIIGDPIADALRSAYGVVVGADIDVGLPDSVLIEQMLGQGTLISSSEFLSTVHSFYSTIIQILISLFVFFGFLSFFLIRNHSIAQLEEQVEDRVTVTFDRFAKSTDFDNKLKSYTDSAVSIDYGEIDETVAKLSDRIAALEETAARLAGAQSDEEPDMVGGEKAPRPDEDAGVVENNKDGGTNGNQEA